METCSTEFEPYFGPHLPPPPRLAAIRRAYPLFGIGGLKMVPRPARSFAVFLAGMAGQLLLRAPPVGRGRAIESGRHIATLIGYAYCAVELSDVQKRCC